MAFQGCAGRAPADLAAELPQEAGWVLKAAGKADFPLTAAVKNGAPGKAFHVYIEGDGFAWRSRGEPSTDPTPHSSGAFKMAAQDGWPNVVYLARPCQFTGALAARKDADWCRTERIWTDMRFGLQMAEVVEAAYREVVPGDVPVTLVGYSGGALHALWLAKHHTNVAEVVTVGGNLRPTMLNRWHHVPVHDTDLDPLAEPGRLADLPLRVIVGEADRIVPPELSRQMLEGVGLRRVTVEVVPGGHGELGVGRRELGDGS